MKHIVSFSGGICSYFAAKRVVQKYGAENTLLLFADTLIEDEDLYRFLDETSAKLGAELVRISKGKTPWQVFDEVGFMGNSRVDPCSRVLKREFLRDWIESHFSPNDCVMYVGIDWSEEHRLEAIQKRYLPYKVEAPMCHAPHWMKWEYSKKLEAEGIRIPRLYTMGYPHNNCGGFCVKSGVSQFVLLYKTQPERYAYHEEQERQFRAKRGPYTILKIQRQGKVIPITLEELRIAIDSGVDLPKYDFGGCGCS